MDCGLTLNELWTLLGAVGFGCLVIGAVLMCAVQAGHSKNVFWEEE